MDVPIITNEAIYSPYYVFVRCNGHYCDRDLLEALGAADYVFDATPSHDRHCVFVADEGEWVHLAEGLSFWLCPGPDTPPGVSALASKHELFTFAVGDADSSYSFEYYREGQLVRRLVVEDPSYRGGVVIEDKGDALPGEPTHPVTDLNGLVESMLRVARGVGISIHHKAGSIRAYTRARD